MYLEMGRGCHGLANDQSQKIAGCFGNDVQARETAWVPIFIRGTHTLAENGFLETYKKPYTPVH